MGTTITRELAPAPAFFGRIEQRNIPEDCRLILEGCRKKNLIERPLRKPVGKYLVQYNEVRGMKPLRNAQQVNAQLNTPFDPKKFHYAPPFLVEGQEYATETVAGVPVSFIANPYPFAPYHMVLVPEREQGHNQFLDTDSSLAQRVLTAAWSLMLEAEDPNFRICFNASGAHASVNQLHFQAFFADGDFSNLPIDGLINSGGFPDKFWMPNAAWVPASLKTVQDTLWHIRALHLAYRSMETKPGPEDTRPTYNLLLHPKGIGILPRLNQAWQPYFKEYSGSGFTTGFGFYELMGEVICPSKAAFDSFSERNDGGTQKTEADIQAIFNSLAVRGNPFSGL